MLIIKIIRINLFNSPDPRSKKYFYCSIGFELLCSKWMPYFYFSQTKKAVRAFVLIGVFVGLLVSSGEGIRLFPFPFADAETNESLGNLNKIPHQFNLHRFENKHASFHAESHGGKFSPHITTSFGIGGNISFVPKINGFQFDEAKLFLLLKSRRVGNDRGKRAPPLV